MALIEWILQRITPHPMSCHAAIFVIKLRVQEPSRSFSERSDRSPLNGEGRDEPDKGRKMKTDKAQATKFFATLFGGDHHIPGKLREFGDGWCVFRSGDISTFDFDLATRIVFLAHDMCMRAEISRAGLYLRIAIHARKRDGGMSERHPTLEQAVERWRETP